MKAALLTLLTAASLFAQSAPPTCAVVSPAAAKLEFAAASVTPASPPKPGPVSPGGISGRIGGVSGGPGTTNPGHITGKRDSLANLLFFAYGLPADQISGPKWVWDWVNHGFDLSATMPATSTAEQSCGMLRNLLVSRFHLVFHRETQTRYAYELTVLPGGPKFRSYDPGAKYPDPGPGLQTDQNGFPELPPQSSTAFAVSFANGMIRASFRNMDRFTQSLPKYIEQSIGVGIPDAPLPRIFDKTGLTGIYEIHLAFAGVPAYNGGSLPDDAAPKPADGPDIFSALQEQLGLKLVRVKDVPVDVLIIDHADQTPTDN